MTHMPDFEPELDIESIPEALISEPLNWLFAEHYRHRQLCKLIEGLARNGVYDEDRLTLVIDFLRHDLPLHILDEEEDLFPLLRRRAQPEDDVERILGILATDHRADQERVSNILAGLERARELRTPPSFDTNLRALLTEFVGLERRHVALENAIVIPIARLRLRPEDLQSLSERLAARRGKVMGR
jgi:iron-sulfur cluster repair protein YtfE (RIC family)